MLGLRKPNFKTKIIPFDKCHNAGNCERGDTLRFFNIHSVTKFQKIEGGLFGDFEKFSKKCEFLAVSAEKSERDPLGFVNVRSVAKYQKNEERTLWGQLKKFEKKSHKAEKGRGLIAEKVRSFCFGLLVKKIAHTHGFEHGPSG